MKDGRKIFQGNKVELVREAGALAQSGLSLPTCITEWNKLAERFGLDHEEPCLTAESAASRIAKLFMNPPATEGDAGSTAASPAEGGEHHA
ncbi:hypothetical protein D3C81_2114290 [compost metagenome]